MSKSNTRDVLKEMQKLLQQTHSISQTGKMAETMIDSKNLLRQARSNQAKSHRQKQNANAQSDDSALLQSMLRNHATKYMNTSAYDSQQSVENGAESRPKKSVQELFEEIEREKQSASSKTAPVKKSHFFLSTSRKKNALFKPSDNPGVGQYDPKYSVIQPATKVTTIFSYSSKSPDSKRKRDDANEALSPKSANESSLTDDEAMSMDGQGFPKGKHRDSKEMSRLDSRMSKWLLRMSKSRSTEIKPSFFFLATPRKHSSNTTLEDTQSESKADCPDSPRSPQPTKVKGFCNFSLQLPREGLQVATSAPDVFYIRPDDKPNSRSGCLGALAFDKRPSRAQLERLDLKTRQQSYNLAYDTNTSDSLVLPRTKAPPIFNRQLSRDSSPPHALRMSNSLLMSLNSSRTTQDPNDTLVTDIDPTAVELADRRLRPRTVSLVDLDRQTGRTFKTESLTSDLFYERDKVDLSRRTVSPPKLDLVTGRDGKSPRHSREAAKRPAKKLPASPSNPPDFYDINMEATAKHKRLGVTIDLSKMSSRDTHKSALLMRNSRTPLDKFYETDNSSLEKHIFPKRVSNLALSHGATRDQYYKMKRKSAIHIDKFYDVNLDHVRQRSTVAHAFDKQSVRKLATVKGSPTKKRSVKDLVAAKEHFDGMSTI